MRKNLAGIPDIPGMTETAPTTSPGPPRGHPAAPSRARRTQVQAAYRRRVAAGRVVIGVELDAAVLDLLVRLRWLDERTANDKAAIGRAVAAMLCETARR
jgi:hypothetical protein